MSDRVRLAADTSCGTYGGYQRHGRERTARCEPCRRAGREYMRAYRLRNPGAYAEEKQRQNARSRALWRLASEYPARFRQMLNDELA